LSHRTTTLQLLVVLLLKMVVQDNGTILNVEP